jgi:hypothetical protein
MSDITSGLPATGAAAPNETVTTASEPIEVNSGEAVSFDQLDAVQENRANIPNEEKTAAKEKPAAKEKKSADKKEKSGEEEAEDDAKPAAKSADAVEKAEKAAKLYKVKIGEKNLDIAANGSLEIEKDGKTIPVTVQDLVNSYHGTSEIHRRLTELDVKSKRYDTDRKTVDTFVDQIASLYKADKPMALVDFLINTAGLDPATYKMKLLESMTPEVEQLSSMLPEEKKAYQLELENQYLRKQQQAQVQEKAKASELNGLETEVKKIQQAHGLDDKQFYGLYRELIDEGGFNENELTPASIAEYADYKAISSHVSAEIKAANPDYEGVEALTSELVEEMMGNSAISLEDLTDIIKSIVIDTSEEDLKEKLSESPRRAKNTQPKNPGNEPLTFDDLNFA